MAKKSRKSKMKILIEELEKENEDDMKGIELANNRIIQRDMMIERLKKPVKGGE